MIGSRPAILLSILLAVAAPSALGATRISPAAKAIAAAVADPARPDKDRGRDAARKPAEMLAFAQVRPDQTVVDVLPGGGYFTRLFARAVGSHGHVYALLTPGFPDSRTDIDPIAKGYANVSVVVGEPDAAAGPGRADLVWTALNYHDLKGGREVDGVNAAAFRALKPGGLYVVVDHAAAAGSGAHDVNSLHRIDPALVKSEIEAAGFKLDGESDILRNLADPHTAKVFDASIRGHTDQFVLRFRKPG